MDVTPGHEAAVFKLLFSPQHLTKARIFIFSGQVNVSFSLRIDAVELEIASAAHLFTMFMTQVAAERDRFKIV